MGCARHDLDRLRCLQARKGLLVEFDDAVSRVRRRSAESVRSQRRARHPRDRAGRRATPQRQCASRAAPQRPALPPLRCSLRTDQAAGGRVLAAVSIQWTTSTSRSASSGISKTLERSCSSSGVSRSNSKVAIPCVFSALATAILRGLNRLEPLPWANTTSALAEAGRRRVPARPSGPITTSRAITTLGSTRVGRGWRRRRTETVSLKTVPIWPQTRDAVLIGINQTGRRSH